MVDTQDGKVPLSYLAEIKSATGPNTINRENVKRKIVISANVSDRDLRSVVDDIRERIDETVVLPEGYFIEYGGQFESRGGSFSYAFVRFAFFFAGCILVVIQSVPKRIAVGGHLAESSVSTYRRRVYLALYDRRDKHTGYYRIYFSFRNRHA